MPFNIYFYKWTVESPIKEEAPIVQVFFFLFRFYLFIFREGKGERVRNIHVWLPLTHPLLGTWPSTLACALTGNRTGNPLDHRLSLNPLSHTSQGCSVLFLLCCDYFVATNLCSLVPSPLSPSDPTLPSTSGNYQFSPCIYESI